MDFIKVLVIIIKQLLAQWCLHIYIYNKDLKKEDKKSVIQAKKPKHLHKDGLF